MPDEDQPTNDERQQTLQEFEDALDLPMAILALATLLLIIARIAVRMDADTARAVTLAITLVWWLFVLEFAIEVFLAPDRWKFIKTHWFEAITVLLPFLRVFYIFRGIRAVAILFSTQSTALARSLVILKRGFKGFADSLAMRSFPIVLGMTVVVAAVGSLSMYFIERRAGHATIRDYGDALWWTMGTITTVGTELYPVTSEGRVVATMLMIYGVSVFGYLAGVLASYFVRMDSEARKRSESPPSSDA